MSDIEVFDPSGNFTASFKFKITEYLRTIPLSDEQVESITKALSSILKEALVADAVKQKKIIDELLAPLRQECRDLRHEVRKLEDSVDAHENQAKGMTKLLKTIVAVVAFVATLFTIYQANKPDPTQVGIDQILKELSHAKIYSNSAPK